MSSVELERIVQFADELLGVQGFPDYSNALNGLQVAGPRTVSRVVAAVDCSEETIQSAVQQAADLLVVHHGLFWGGLQPITGRHFRKVDTLIRGGLALYSAHLPLDAHRDVGNCAVLARELGVDVQGPFGAYQGTEIGWWGTTELDATALARRLTEVLGSPPRVVSGGAGEVRRVAVVTGGGSSFLTEASEQGLDALITGEAPHHSYHEARELGVTLYLGGHYATETWGVRALSQRIADEFGLEWSFIDVPTGF
jgi:dinuclear metal center YbgI/SA1388 family protein